MMRRLDSPNPEDPHDPLVCVQVDDEFQSLVDVDWLRQVAEAALVAEGCPDCELGLYVTGDEQIRYYNREYRSIDTSTDVLSFGGNVAAFVSGPESRAYAGDIVLSYPRAEAQAQSAGHTIEAELALLIVHGVLHLLGQDHETDEARRRMWDQQNFILGRLGLSVGTQPGEDSD